MLRLNCFVTTSVGFCGSAPYSTRWFQVLDLLKVARQPADVTYDDDDDVLRDRLQQLTTSRDVTNQRHHYHHHHQQQQQQNVDHSRRNKRQQKHATIAPDSDSSSCVSELAVRGRHIDGLSDVLLTRVFYSGLASDDLCRCAAVCRRWNRLVWNPLLWTCVDLSHAPDCDADAALRLPSFARFWRDTAVLCCIVRLRHDGLCVVCPSVTDVLWLNG